MRFWLHLLFQVLYWMRCALYGTEANLALGIIETIPNAPSIHSLKKNTPNFTSLLDFMIDVSLCVNAPFVFVPDTDAAVLDVWRCKFRVVQNSTA